MQTLVFCRALAISSCSFSGAIETPFCATPRSSPYCILLLLLPTGVGTKGYEFALMAALSLMIRNSWLIQSEVSRRGWRGLATSRPQNAAIKGPQNCGPLLMGG